MKRICMLVIFSALFLCQKTVAGTPNNNQHFYDDFVRSSQKQILIDRVKNSPIQPPSTHPRLYGSNPQWYQTIVQYESMDPFCNWQGVSGQGTIKNIKSAWDRQSLGGEVCKSGTRHAVPSSLNDHAIAKNYMNNTISHWNINDALKIIHLIRRMNHCHTISSSCVYSQQEINQLSVSFLNYEFSRIKNSPRNSSGYIESWHRGYKGQFFDLGSYPAFKLWTLILDTFWNSPLISSSDRQFIQDELENEIDSYIATYHLPTSASGTLGRWALHNGNNWNPILNAAALFWAITFWNEAPYTQKAKDVLHIVLESSWLHRDFILNDGAYREGPSYLDVSLNGATEINNLLMASFGEPNHAIKWGLMADKTTDWMLENIASDGKFIDFGDAWAKNGYANFYFVDLLYWEEMVGLKAPGAVVADPCKLQRYFSTSYYLHTFYDPWRASSHYARDFYTLTYACHQAQDNLKTTLFPTYKMSTLRQFLPGSTSTGALVSPVNIRNQQADQTFLAGNGVSNTIAHREVDFGALIWSAFGNRLLSDWGYGEISKTYDFFKVRGSKGHFIASDDHTLEFYLKHISGQLKIDRLFISLKLKGVSVELPLSNYISTMHAQTWTKVSIPMSDFSILPNGWQGKGDGLESIRLKTTGFVTNGEFGLDEINILDAQGNTSIQWYGDTHGESLEPTSVVTTTPQINVPSALALHQIESVGGANGTQKWARFSATGSYSLATIFYRQGVADLVISNYMDYLPIGANTLILPNAQDANAVQPENTHTSQFIGQAGEVDVTDIDGHDVVHMNASEVYGKSLNDGNLHYFHRYLIPFKDGNFVVIDAFEAKPGKQDYIQEFWYSHKDAPTKKCSEKSQDVMQAIDNQGALLLTPQCNTLQKNNLVESFGRIVPASMHPGSFVLGAPDFMKNNAFFNRFVEGNGLYLINRVGQKEMRRLARFTPDHPVHEDVRVFLLQSSTSSVFDDASVTKVNCHHALCFNVEIADSDSLMLGFNRINEEYTLTNITTASPTKNPSPPPTKGKIPLVFIALLLFLQYFRRPMHLKHE
ncbi:Uncharacterised protein [BD1-7 clade bacterium]|nr:Uncharacterised protein [BD1-7 clade bacterium]